MMQLIVLICNSDVSTSEFRKRRRWWMFRNKH
jgi:hypothetical protein